MASVKQSGLGMNFEEGDGRPDTESVSDGETLALPVFYQTDSPVCNPYFPFSDSNSDSGSISCPDTGPDPDRSFIDFFDRESYEVDAVEEFYSDPDPGLRIIGDFNLWGFQDAEEDEVEEDLVLGLGFRSRSGSGSDLPCGDSSGLGLRVTGIDSDSDFEDGVFDTTSSDNGNGETVSDRVGDGSGLPPVWDSIFGEEAAIVADEELEWEEVQNAITWTHEPVQIRVLNRPNEEGELSSSSRISSRDDHEYDLDWEVILAVNNVVNYIEQAEGINTSVDDIDENYHLFLASIGYGENHGDYDAILGQMFDSEIGIRGSPPAAKRVMEDLPIVELTMEEMEKGDIVCAICKDEMVIEEKVRRLPCRHYYHGDCIIPWLRMRNTCPVCRYELPTDDPEYEMIRRQQRSSDNLAMEPLVR